MLFPADHLVRHGGMLHSAAAINGVAGGPPSLSPATTLSKVVSLNSLASCSPHVVGALPPGDALSPPLSDSPQQLSPRELEAQQREAEQQQQQFFGSARDGREGAPPVPPLPLGALQQQQQLHQQQQQQQYMQQQGYGVHGHYAASMQQQAYAQPPYANGHAAGHAEQHPHQHSALYRGAGGLSRPPLGSSGSLSQLAAASSSWPRLHPQPQANGSLPPPAQHAYAPTSARGGASAFAMQQPSLHPQQQQHAYGGSPSTTAYYAANGAAGGFHPASSRHSRNGSVCYDRPGSAGQPGMLVARSPSPLDLAGLERLDPQPLALTATPYNWQHRCARGCLGGQHRVHGWGGCEGNRHDIDPYSAPFGRPPRQRRTGFIAGACNPHTLCHPRSHTPSDKIVSLSPGATEMLWALGLGARVAAVTDACDHPPEAGARAKARRSLAVPPGRTASYASLERHPSVSSGSNSGAASRRESPTVAGGRSGAAAWAAAAADGQLAEVVDEEVLARERPGLVVYEEAPEQACCGGGAEGLPPGSALCASGCGMGRAVLEALVAVGLQQSCRVVCVRRRTLADVLDSMLLVRGRPARVVEGGACMGSRQLSTSEALSRPGCTRLCPDVALCSACCPPPAGRRGRRGAGGGAVHGGPLARAAAPRGRRGRRRRSSSALPAARAGAAVAAPAAHRGLVGARPADARGRRLRAGGGGGGPAAGPHLGAGAGAARSRDVALQQDPPCRPVPLCFPIHPP